MRRRWTITLLLTPLLLAVVALAVYRCHSVPLSQCSEVYQRYHDTPGIQASFIKDKQINDTITADMTILVAEDSTSYVWLLKDLGYSDDLIEFYMFVSFSDEDNRFTGKYNNSVIADFPQKRTVILFDSQNETDKTAILEENLKESLKIKT